MQIFQQEYDDGISEIVRSAARISYASLVEPCTGHSLSKALSHMKSISALEDQDLYYVQSILVTSNWNKNDDIFDKTEIWAARNTPEDKPTNLEHDESLIIGHITANWPITPDGMLIDENTPAENLPNKFHILTGSVIYRAFSKPELKERSEKLIAEIETGQKYVSMECLFKGFDYGLKDKSTGEYKILSRDNNTAYLTKYLRAYGGRGEHEQYQIGRVLRNITFSGKGFVDKPANPESIIFTKNEIDQTELKNISFEKNTNFVISGVSNYDPQQEVENINMNLETDIAEIKKKIESLATVAGTTDCSNAVKEAYASVSAAENTIKELNDSVKTNEETLNQKKAEMEALKVEKEEALTQKRAEMEALKVEKEEAAKKMKEDMDMKEEEMKKMKAELDTALETIAAYKDKEDKMMKAEKKMKRMAALIENGVESEIASSTVDKFEGLNDEAFDAIAALLAAKNPPVKEVKEEEAMMMKKKASEDNSADPDILETAEVEANVNLGIGGDADNPAETTRAALVEFVSSRLGKKL